MILEESANEYLRQNNNVHPKNVFWLTQIWDDSAASNIQIQSHVSLNFSFVFGLKVHENKQTNEFTLQHMSFDWIFIIWRARHTVENGNVNKLRGRNVLHGDIPWHGSRRHDEYLFTGDLFNVSSISIPAVMSTEH